jgi:hypothetical protein
MRDPILGKSFGSVVLPLQLRGPLFAGALAGTLCVAASVASADEDAQQKAYARLLGEDLDVWKAVDGHVQVAGKSDQELRRCDYHLAGLTRWKAPESLTFELEHDTPELKAGRYPWPQARAACTHLMVVAERTQKLDRLTWVIFNCKDDMTREGGNNILEHYEMARRTYDEAIAAGIPATEIIEQGGVTGTIKELFEKLCLAGQATRQAAEDTRAAPFKKLLKNDKLRIALQDADFIMLPNGARATPDHLAAAGVWFEDASPSKRCPNGAQVHVLHRYQFDAQQKLAKVTDREYCGRPPAAAFH